MARTWHCSAAPAARPRCAYARPLTSLLISACGTWLARRGLGSLQQVIGISNPVDVADNLRARQIQTQSRVLLRTLSLFIVLIGAAAMLMTFPSARQFGTRAIPSPNTAHKIHVDNRIRRISNDRSAICRIPVTL